MRVHVWIFQAIGYCTWKRYRHPTVPMPAVNEKRLHTFFNRTYQQWPKTAVSLQKTGDQMMGLKLNDATSNLQHACLVARVRDFWKTMVRFYRYRGDVKIREQRYHEQVPCIFLLCGVEFCYHTMLLPSEACKKFSIPDFCCRHHRAENFNSVVTAATPRHEITPCISHAKQGQ